MDFLLREGFGERRGGLTWTPAPPTDTEPLLRGSIWTSACAGPFAFFFYLLISIFEESQSPIKSSKVSKLGFFYGREFGEYF